LIRLDGAAQKAAFAHQMLLPQELIQVPRAHPVGQGAAIGGGKIK
jgi:hypothetical protein